MVEVHDDGTVEFRTFCREADFIEVVGSFHGWRRPGCAMTCLGDGWWSCRMNLDAGDYEFAYAIDEREWRPDFAAHGVRSNQYGGWTSGLHVPPRRPATIKAPAILEVAAPASPSCQEADQPSPMHVAA